MARAEPSGQQRTQQRARAGPAWETKTLHLAALAAAKAAASCGRRSRASTPLPVSASTHSAMRVIPSASANRAIRPADRDRAAVIQRSRRGTKADNLSLLYMGSFADHTSTAQRRAILRELGTRLRIYFRGMTDVLPARFIGLLEQLRAEEMGRQAAEQVGRLPARLGDRAK